MDVVLRWTGGMQFEGSNAVGRTVTMDTHPESGGQDRGPTPMETLLIALAGCTAMDIVPILRKMRAPLEDLTLHVSGKRATEHPKVLTDIHVRYVARGRGLTEEQVEKAVRLSQEKYCSISAMLRLSARLTTEVVVEDGVAAERAIA